MEFKIKVVSEEDKTMFIDDDAGRIISLKAYIKPETITENDKIHLKQYRIDPNKEYAHFITFDAYSISEMVWKGLSKKEIYERVIKSCIFFVWERKWYFFENIDHFFGIASKYADEVLEMIREYEKVGFDLKLMWEQTHEEEIEMERQKRETLLEALGLNSVADNK